MYVYPFSLPSSCREGCRRAFRGILHIPGCKTLCFKCVLLPCYSNTDSDDEKDKDDEGYDSYGNTDNHAHPTQDDGHDTSGSLGQVTHHDYVNSVDYTNVEIAETGQSQSADNVYVPMQLESLDHLVATRSVSASEKVLLSNTDLMTCRLKVECPDPTASYVNVPETSPLLKGTGEDSTVSEKNSGVTDVIQEVGESKTDGSKQHSKMAANQTPADKALKQSIVVEEGARTDNSSRDTTTLNSSTSVEEIEGPSGKKMVLLETDL